MTRLDRKTGKVLGTTTVGQDPRQLAFGYDSVWVTNNGDNTVTRLDPQTGQRRRLADPVGQKPLGIASGAGGDLGRQPRIRHRHPDRAGPIALRAPARPA